MKNILIAIMVLNLVLAGCSNVRTYIFKKERVDQEMSGNRGYIVGTPPPQPAIREIPKRTMIGIDIEIPLLPGEELRLKRGPSARGSEEIGSTVAEDESIKPEETGYEKEKEEVIGENKSHEVTEEEFIK